MTEQDITVGYTEKHQCLRQDQQRYQDKKGKYPDIVERKGKDYS